MKLTIVALGVGQLFFILLVLATLASAAADAPASARIETDGNNVLHIHAAEVEFTTATETALPLSSLIARIDSTEDAVNSLEAAAMTSLGTVSTSVASALFELSQTLTTASADFSVAQSNVLDQAKTGLQTSIEAAASAYVDPLDSTETKLRSVIDGAKAAAIDAAKTETTAQAGSLETKIGNAIAAVKGELSTNVADVSTLAETVNSTLASRITTLESNAAEPYKFKSCDDIAAFGIVTSQFYDTYPDGKHHDPLQVYCDYTVNPYSVSGNLALHKTVSMSSSTQGSKQGATDGIRNGVFSQGSCTHSATELHPWLMIDLGKPYIVTSVFIFGRTDCCPERLNSMNVKLGLEFLPSPAFIKQMDPCFPGPLPAPALSGQSYTCVSPTPARYVALMLDTAVPNIISVCEFEVYGTEALVVPPSGLPFPALPKNYGGWTLLASAPSTMRAFTSSLRDYYNQPTPPHPQIQGVLDYYFTKNLKDYFSMLYVENSRGQWQFYDLNEITGPLVIDSANTVVSAETSYKGIVFGNNSPVIEHFQVGRACSQAHCRAETESKTEYSYGVMIYFDWHPSDDNYSLDNTAHFGGTAQMESFWASRGVRLLAK